MTYGHDTDAWHDLEAAWSDNRDHFTDPDGPVLWDADPDVCCAAAQLGACPHTELDEYTEEDDPAYFAELAARPAAPRVEAPALDGDEPF